MMLNKKMNSCFNSIPLQLCVMCDSHVHYVFSQTARTTNNNGGFPSCNSDKFIQASPLKCRCSSSTTVISEALQLSVPVLMHAFIVVVLFVCTHGSAVECFMHRSAVFVCSGLLLWYYYTTDQQPALHTTTFSAVCVNTRTQGEDPSVLSSSCFQQLPSIHGPNPTITL